MSYLCAAMATFVLITLSYNIEIDYFSGACFRLYLQPQILNVGIMCSICDIYVPQ